MNGNSGARLMYLLTHTPADDRVGRSVAHAPAIDGPIGGPAFEMPDSSAPAPATAPAVRTWSAPADRAIVDAGKAPAPAVVPAETLPADVDVDTTAPAASAGAQLAGNARKAFMLAGKAIFTLQGAETRYTFKISRDDGSDRFPGVKYFVALLTGPDNLQDYTYCGMLDPASGVLRTTKKSTYTADSKPIKAFNWVIGRVWRDASIEPAQLFHVGRCGRCGRALTVPSSIETGLGPECAAKLGA